MKTFYKIGRGLFIILLSTALLMNIVSIVKRITTDEKIPLALGFGNAVILTGSMKPEINEGDFIIIHKQKSYEVNDVVTYRTANTPVTHRIVEKTPDGYVTQGDANNAADGEIAAERVIGKVVVTVPKAGNAILFFQRPEGMLLLFALLFAISQAPKLFRSISSLAARRKNNT